MFPLLPQTFNRILLLLLLVFPLRQMAHSQGVTWAAGAGGPDGLELGLDADVDPMGNMYFTGMYKTDAYFDTLLCPALGNSDIYLVKYDADGNLKWFFSDGGTPPDRGNGIYAGLPDRIYLTGFAKVGVSPPESELHSRDIYLARIDTNGNLQWRVTVDGNNYGEGESVVADAAGNVYVTGVFNTRAYFGPGDTLTAVGLSDVFVAKYTADGSYEWSRSFGTTGDDFGFGIGLDATGNVYVSGYYSGQMVVGPDTLKLKAGKDAFLIKLTDAGTPVWGRSIRGNGTDQALGLAVGLSGNSYLTGTFSDSLFFPSDTMKTLGSVDSWVARYDSAGNYVWSRQLGGANSQNTQDISLDNKERLFITGYFKGSLTADTITLVSGGYEDIFVLRLDSLGAGEIGRSWGALSSEYGFGVAGDQAGNIFFTGSYGPTLALDSVTLNSWLGTEDIYFGRWCDSLSLTLTDMTGPPRCINDNFNVSFDATGCFGANNVFYILLSDAAGSFSAPDTVGLLAGPYGGDVLCTIPPGVTGGSAYRVRVQSSFPAMTSNDNGTDFNIVTSVSDPVIITGDTIICAGDSVQLDAGSGYMSYAWSTGDATQIILVYGPGVYFVDVVDSLGCTTRGEHTLTLCVSRDQPATSHPEIEVWPNPNNGSFDVRIQDLSLNEAQFNLYDIHGRVIFSQHLGRESKGEFHFQNSQLPSGIYLIEIRTPEWISTTRISVSR